MAYFPELVVRCRIAAARARLLMSSGAAATLLERRIDHSIRTAFPDLSAAERAELYVRHWISMRKFALIKQYLTSLQAGELNTFLDRHVRVEGREHLDAVMESEAPVIFVTPHYGNFAAGCLKLIKEIGHRKTINAFYNPPLKSRASQGFEELFHRLGYGYNALFNDDTAVLKALRVLKRGEALTMMPDVFDIAGHVLYVPFFGRLIPAMAGTALFALKGGANVIVGYNCPGAGLASTLKLGAPIRVERSGDLEADLATLTTAIFAELEAQIRAAPEHWMYLPRMGDLLADRLPVDATAHTEWMGKLESATRQFASVLPEWPGIMDELKSIPLDGGKGLAPPPGPDTYALMPAADSQESPTAHRPFLL